MKHLMPYITCFLLGTTALLSSCKKDTADGGFTTSAFIVQGTWKITLYKENGSDQTVNYNGYVFTFVKGGTATADFGRQPTNGTWSTNNDNSDNKLILDFGNLSPLDKIKEDWHVLSASATKIVMEHVSGGGGGTDYLTIEKI